MIELRILCDRCKTPKELNLDNYTLNMDNELSLAGYESVTAGEEEYWFCAECKRDWDELQDTHTNKELEFVKS